MNADTIINELVYELEQVLSGPDGAEILAGIGALSGILLFVFATAMIISVIKLICRWRIFNKAGEKGWKVLIPIYNTYTEFSFTWSARQGLLLLAALLISQIITATCAPDSFMQIIAFIAAVYAGVVALMQTHKLSLSFGHKFGFTLGLIFLNTIFMLILAFDKNSRYLGPAVKSK